VCYKEPEQIREVSCRFAAINLDTDTKSHRPIQRVWKNDPTSNRVGSGVLLAFDPPTSKPLAYRFGTAKMPGKRILALILLAATLPSFQPGKLRAEPVVQVVTQSSTVSTVNEADMGLRSPLPIRLSLSMRGGYDDNAVTTGGGSGSLFTSENIALSYSLRKERTQLSVNSGAGIVYFAERATGRVNSYLNLALSHNVSLRLRLAISAYAAYQAEPDFSSDIGVDRVGGNYFYTTDTLSATYNWSSRFSTVTSYKFRLVRYDDSSIGAFQDRLEDTFGEELRFNLLRRTTLIAEYRFQMIDYDSAPLDSITHFILAGVDHKFNSRLNLVVRGGTTLRSYNDDGDRTSPRFEGSLTYAGAHKASVSWTARYGVEESNIANASSRTSFRTGLQLRYNLCPRVTSTANLYYYRSDNQGLSLPGQVSQGFSREGLDLSVGLRYVINRHFTFDLNYSRTDVSSGNSGDYSRNRYFAGLNFTY
jgi:hypothetical protein